MDDRQKCKTILNKMRANGHDVAPCSWVDSWDQDEVEYFLANYEESYL